MDVPSLGPGIVHVERSMTDFLALQRRFYAEEIEAVACLRTPALVDARSSSTATLLPRLARLSAVRIPFENVIRRSGGSAPQGPSAGPRTKFGE